MKLLKGLGCFPTRFEKLQHRLNFSKCTSGYRRALLATDDFILASAISSMEISGKRKQKVHIEYDLVGYIPVDELIEVEQA